MLSLFCGFNNPGHPEVVQFAWCLKVVCFKPKAIWWHPTFESRCIPIHHWLHKEECPHNLKQTWVLNHNQLHSFVLNTPFFVGSEFKSNDASIFVFPHNWISKLSLDRMPRRPTISGDLHALVRRSFGSSAGSLRRHFIKVVSLMKLGVFRWVIWSG